MVPGLPSAGPPPIFPETENLNRENLNLHAFSKNPKFKPAQPPFAGLNFGPISRGLNLIPPGIKKKVCPPQDHDGLRFVFPLVPFFETSQSWVVILENIGNEYSGDFFVPGMRIFFFWILGGWVASG